MTSPKSIWNRLKIRSTLPWLLLFAFGCYFATSIQYFMVFLSYFFFHFCIHSKIRDSNAIEQKTDDRIWLWFRIVCMFTQSTWLRQIFQKSCQPNQLVSLSINTIILNWKNNRWSCLTEKLAHLVDGIDHELPIKTHFLWNQCLM